MITISKLNDKIEKLTTEYTQLIEILRQGCWDSKREKIISATTSTLSGFDFIEDTPEKRLIPQSFFQKYRNWYSTAKAIIEANFDKESLEEFKKEYESISAKCTNQYLTEDLHLSMIDQLNHQIIILQSLPSYLEGRRYDLEISIATTLMGDELKEAKILLDKKFIRAAGAIAGVILERHIKYRFDKASPSIKYGEKATLGQLINKAEEHNFFETAIIFKLKYLNNVRISCDHDKKSEPKENEVKDLIDQTDRFIHFLD